MLLIVINIVFSILNPNTNSFTKQLDDYIISYFADYDSVSYTIHDDLSETAKVEINGERSSNRIGDKFFVPVSMVDKHGINKDKYLMVQVSLFQNVFVANTQISKDDPIDNFNSSIELKNITELNHEPFTEVEELGSVISKYDIQPGTIICKDYLDALPVMNVGDQINLVYQVGTVQVSLIGTVRQSGAIGDVVKIKSNNQQYSAKIINSQKALIIE